MSQMNMLEAIRSGLADAMAEDERVFVLGEDVAIKGGVFLATDGLLKRFGEQRVVDMPIAEASIVGIAIGASLHGLRPVAEIQFADYIHPAIDQILNEAARFRYRSNGDWSCPIVVRAPFGAGVHGGFYHSQDPDPVIFFEHKQLYRMQRAEVPDGTYTVPLGQAAVCRAGADISLFTYGLMVHYSLAAADVMAAEGVDVEVIDLRTLYPLDVAAILASVRKTGKALIVHEDNLTGGLGGEIGAIIAEQAFEHLDGPVRRLAAPDVPAVAFNDDLEAHFMLDPAKIAAAIRDLAAY
jgi:2-oxoisovalerate dehydrogenase E1 component beta subunit